MFPKMPKCADYWKKEYLMDNVGTQYSKWLLSTDFGWRAHPHSGAYHALTLHRIIEINLSFPMESNYGFGS